MGGVPVVSAHENNVFPFSSTNYFSVKRLIEQIKEPVTGLPCVLWTISYSWDHIFSTTNAGLEIFTCSSHKHQQLGSVITNLLSPFPCLFGAIILIKLCFIYNLFRLRQIHYYCSLFICIFPC